NIEISILGKQINEGNYRNWVRDASRPPGMLYKMINDNGVEETINKFNEMRSKPDSKLNAFALNIPGYMLMKEGRYEEAIKVMKANMEAFPEIANVYDSYAEALTVGGQINEAVKYYELSLEKDPENQNAKEILRHLKL
ncbi:MAG: tetratricopeptide repeat protein, partial [Bacteroidota bacterium]